MQPVFSEEIKHCNQLMGIPEIGYYALFRNDLNCSPDWQKCRETFSGEFTLDTQGFYFSHEENQSDGIAYFIRKFEDIIDVERSKFKKTDKIYALWIEPSIFWKECVMRRSLFTALCRCGMIYKVDKDNFDEALWSQSYTRNTELAVKRFLFGFTKIIIGNDYLYSNKNGWQTLFENKTIEQVRKQLIKSEQVETIGNFLWS